MFQKVGKHLSFAPTGLGGDRARSFVLISTGDWRSRCGRIRGQKPEEVRKENEIVQKTLEKFVNTGREVERGGKGMHIPGRLFVVPFFPFMSEFVFL